ncbi:quinone oxidoreductase family protein [Robbsia andropogonis]|uniref:quinone oxidoreductase family protein n=1 Tax=Robbsia andropogonis TaxID=28092 RepID=UPI002A6A3A1C|nr:zinc-binding alcohol dehydrogenase family protein [Robbsia andropogonis]
MKAAVVVEAGGRPQYLDFEEPIPAHNQVLINVQASALSQLARGKAFGSHYSSTGRFPFIAGVDGVGVREDGTSVYFLGIPAPFGAMAQRTVVPETMCVPLPVGLDAAFAAALAIPGMSSWAALLERARFVKGETVLINGGTGASGRLAVQIAKHLGARKVIATGRDVRTLDALGRLGADAVVSLDQAPESVADALTPHLAEGVDVVLDYLWGPSARTLLTTAAKVLPEGYPLRFVQIGTIGGAELTLPGAVLRASAITLLGSGIGSIPMPRLLEAVKGVLQAAISVQLEVDIAPVPLSAMADYWDTDSRARTVFLTEQ